MRDKILSIIKELGFATFDEIKAALGDDARKKTIEDNLENVELEGEAIRIFSGENTLEKEGFISGPNLELEDNLEIRKILVEKGLSERQGIIRWDVLSNRLIKELRDKIQGLTEELEKMYKDPKTLEMEYFEYSIRYHELYGLLNEKADLESLKTLSEMLKNCRLMLEKLDYKGTP